MIDHCEEHMILKPCIKCENKQLHQQVETWKETASRCANDCLKLQEENERLRGALIESVALNENWVGVAEVNMLEHLSEYRAVIKQSNEALNKQDK